MEHFVIRENIAHYEARLRTEIDPGLRATIQRMLKEQKQKLAQLQARPALGGPDGAERKQPEPHPTKSQL